MHSLFAKQTTPRELFSWQASYENPIMPHNVPEEEKSSKYAQNEFFILKIVYAYWKKFHPSILRI